MLCWSEEQDGLGFVFDTLFRKTIKPRRIKCHDARYQNRKWCVLPISSSADFLGGFDSARTFSGCEVKENPSKCHKFSSRFLSDEFLVNFREEADESHKKWAKIVHCSLSLGWWDNLIGFYLWFKGEKSQSCSSSFTLGVNQWPWEPMPNLRHRKRKVRNNCHWTAPHCLPGEYSRFFSWLVFLKWHFTAKELVIYFCEFRVRVHYSLFDKHIVLRARSCGIWWQNIIRDRSIFFAPDNWDDQIIPDTVMWLEDAIEGCFLFLPDSYKWQEINRGIFLPMTNKIVCTRNNAMININSSSSKS